MVKRALGKAPKIKDRVHGQEIDQLVFPTGTMYELHGLTEEEIRIVEGE
jgi:hypothetical protein